MFFRGTNPNERESLEKLRLSPMTKYVPCGTVTGSADADAVPSERQQ